MIEEKVVGVIVTYHPHIERLSDLLSTLHSQVHLVVVVDNGSGGNFKTWLSKHLSRQVYSVFLDENRGIAAAQNLGVRWAKERSASHVLLLDQDSLPASDMVARLLKAVSDVTTSACKIAAAGPRFQDGRHHIRAPFSQIRGMRIIRGKCDDVSSIVKVDYLIASGCLVPASVFDAVGMMREDFFIDYVDIEWGLRAKQHGFELLGVCSARMGHNLGEEPIKLAGRAFPVRDPIRHYYLFRNAIWLYCHLPVPVNWKLVDGWRLLMKYVFYMLFARPRLAHLQMMTMGILHGVRGRLGKLDV